MTNNAYMDLFFNTEMLAQYLVYYVNHVLEEQVDPVTTALVAMAQSPVQLILNQTGIFPFKSSTLHLIPFRYIPQKQREFLQATLRDGKKSFHRQSAGSILIKVNSVLPSDKVLVRREDLLQCLLATMQNSVLRQDLLLQENLTRILVQRFLAAVPLPAEKVQAAYAKRQRLA
jgi:hypothetical protein